MSTLEHKTKQHLILLIFGFLRNSIAKLVMRSFDVVIELISEYLFTSNECRIDRGNGLIMGGAVGDSLGCFVEFSFATISDSQMQKVLQMAGEGGTWGDCCTKGQVTDDTEIGMALSYALLCMKNENNNIFNVKYICFEYYKWYESGPFDIGQTTLKSIIQSENGRNADKMRQCARKYNTFMKETYRGLGGIRSNGSLMRIMPLILYCYKIYKDYDLDAIYDIIVSESSLTHYNQVIFHCNMSYCVAALYLLHNYHEKDRNKKAYFAAKDWLFQQLKKYDLQSEHASISDDCNINIEEEFEDTLEVKISCCTEVLEWIYNACEGEEDFSPTTQIIGHVKIAFERAFYYLYNGYLYATAIIEVIESGGDTDTNGCIVGALLGCYYGLNELNKQTLKYKWCQNIMNCKPRVDYEKRKIYQPQLYFKQNIVQQLLS